MSALFRTGNGVLFVYEIFVAEVYDCALTQEDNGSSKKV